MKLNWKQQQRKKMKREKRNINTSSRVELMQLYVNTIQSGQSVLQALKLLREVIGINKYNKIMNFSETFTEREEDAMHRKMMTAYQCVPWPALVRPFAFQRGFEAETV